MKKQTRRYVLTLTLSLLVTLLVSLVFNRGGFEQLEWQLDDVKTRLIRTGTEAHPDVLLLLIDEASLSAMDPVVGRWPWPRSIWGDVLEFLSLSGAESAIFDILFTERSGLTGTEAAVHDQILIEMTEASGIATHAMQILEDPHNPHANRSLPDIFAEKFSLHNVTGLPFSNNNTWYIPFDGLYQVADQMAVVEFSPDADGKYRRTRLLRDYQQEFYPVLSVAPLVKRWQLTDFTQQKRRLLLNDLEVPLGRDGYYRVNFYDTFETFSMAGVLASIEALRRGDIEALYTDPNLIPPDTFENKIVYIGASAVGLEDLKDTSIHNRWPGVYLHASITSNLLYEDFLYQTSQAWTYAFILLAALLTWISMVSNSRTSLQTGLPLSIGLGFLALTLLLQAEKGILLDTLPVLASLLASWVLISAYLSATEGKEKRRVRNMLSQYVSPAALSTVLDNYQEDMLAAEVGQEVDMSIAFSDVRSFTTLCEGLNAPQVVKLLNIHLDAMTEVTFDYKGTMDKFIGDATMAFWGAPIPDDDHAYHATLAAINMDRAMVKVNSRLTQEGLPNVAVGIGVNSGPVVLGNIGSSRKLDYTVIGDAVNLGSRMEGLTKMYGVPVLISEFTFEKLHGRIPCALVDAVRVKGKNKPVRIYAPLVEPEKEQDQLERGFAEAQLCEQAFETYQSQDFTKAAHLYQQLPDGFRTYREMMLHRCEVYLQQPPPADWDGVFTLDSK